MILVFASASCVRGQALETGPEFRPNVLPLLTIPRLEGSIQIDGRVDEEAWMNAGHVNHFSENFPHEGARPPIDIDVFTTYDDDHMYVAFRIEDDPSRIRANLTERDNMFQDDYAGFILDTNGDGQVTYFIAANPLGIQGDTRTAGGNEDDSFDLIYESAGHVTDTGYEIEMAIPFRSLRFPARDIQTWRITYWITHPRESRAQYTWAGISRDDPCFACQFGTITGLKGVESGNNLEIIPALTGSQTAVRKTVGGLDGDPVTAEPSLNLKYGISSSLTADLTVNPDFSQIESDATQIDINSTFALSYPERRTFFSEGADLFETDIPLVYTRSINDPITAAKLSGRSGGWSYGYIGARDQVSPILMPFEENSILVTGGKSISNIARVRRSFEDNSFLAATITDRRLDDGGSGTVLGLDGSMRFRTVYSLSWEAALSRTTELNDAAMSSISGLDGLTFSRGEHTVALDGESFRGHGLVTQLSRSARHWGFDMNYEQSSPTFRTDNGFVTQNDQRTAEMYQQYTFWPQSSSLVDRLTIWTGASRTWNYENTRKSEWVAGGAHGSFTHQTFVEFNYNLSNELYAGKQFDGIGRVYLEVESNFSSPMQAGFDVTIGRGIRRDPANPEIGKRFNIGGWARLRPTSRLVIQPNIDFSRLSNLGTGERFFSGYIARTRTTYQFSRKLSTRVVAQYNQFSASLTLDPLVTYRVNPFTVFHVGSSHRFDEFTAGDPSDPDILRQTYRQIFFKLQVLFRK